MTHPGNLRRSSLAPAELPTRPSGRARSLGRSPTLFVILTLCLFIAISNAQQGRRGIGPDSLPDEPQVLGFGDQRFRVVPIKGFFRPSAVDFLPNGDILVAERSGGLRIIRDGVLDPEPIRGMPEVHNGYGGRLGLWDVAVHPQFAENRLVYFTYLKPDPSEEGPEDAGVSQGLAGTSVLARGRFDGANSLTGVEDIFVSNARVSGFSVARLIFAPDGKIFMSIGMPLRDREHGGSNRIGTAEQSQEPGSHAGKIPAPERRRDRARRQSLRRRPGLSTGDLRPGLPRSAGPDHPSRDRRALGSGARSAGRRRAQHRQAGPELRLAGRFVRPRVHGRGHGGHGRDGSGVALALRAGHGAAAALLVSRHLSAGGMALYTGDRFPAWKGSLFVGGMSTTQLQRIVLNQRGLPVRHIPLLTELNQRIRDVKQGPDGLLYVTTDHEAGAVLRIEPVEGDGAN